MLIFFNGSDEPNHNLTKSNCKPAKTPKPNRNKYKQTLQQHNNTIDNIPNLPHFLSPDVPRQQPNPENLYRSLKSKSIVPIPFRSSFYHFGIVHLNFIDSLVKC